MTRLVVAAALGAIGGLLIAGLSLPGGRGDAARCAETLRACARASVGLIEVAETRVGVLQEPR